jgi:hypothetical protein
MLPVKETLNVIDAYHGRGTIWKNIQKRYVGKINITKIDKEQKTDDFILLGDNVKYLSSLKLSRYDVIDLDAYGMPFDNLKLLFDKKYHGIVFVTFVQSVFGVLQNQFLIDLGYTEAMIEKSPTLLCKKGLPKIKNWLSLHGVKKIRIRTNGRKSYIAFQC